MGLGRVSSSRKKLPSPLVPSFEAAGASKVTFLKYAAGFNDLAVAEALVYLFPKEV